MVNSSANQNRKKKMGKFKPKGRIANQAAINNVKAILPENLQRDMLIEYLHLIQDKFSHLSSDNLSALAFIMNLPLSEIWDTLLRESKLYGYEHKGEFKHLTDYEIYEKLFI